MGAAQLNGKPLDGASSSMSMRYVQFSMWKEQSIMVTKSFLDRPDTRLAYLDFGGPGRPLLALHGHFGRATMWAPLAIALAPAWRVIALDQRGHGWSTAASDYSRAAYRDDVIALLAHLELDSVVLVGHSLGAANAYQLAAYLPDQITGLVIEDIGAVIDDDISFATVWPKRFATFQALKDFLETDDPYFFESVVEYIDGWGFRFAAEDMVRSQAELNGDWWHLWSASTCPALLLHGEQSNVLSSEQAREMVARRPNTTLVEFPKARHTIHDDDRDGFLRAVAAFLGRI